MPWHGKRQLYIFMYKDQIYALKVNIIMHKIVFVKYVTFFYIIAFKNNLQKIIIIMCLYVCVKNNCISMLLSQIVKRCDSTFVRSISHVCFCVASAWAKGDTPSLLHFSSHLPNEGIQSKAETNMIWINDIWMRECCSRFSFWNKVTELNYTRVCKSNYVNDLF